MSIKIGIAGSGLAGRLLALECLQRGWHVSLFDQDTLSGEKSCGWAAAGMIAPYTELEASEPLLFELGMEAIAAWPTILANLIEPVSFHFPGTLIVSHPQDAAELTRFRSILERKLARNAGKIKPISREKLETLAPGISTCIREGFWLPEEGSIDSVEFFHSTTAFLRHHRVTWFDKTKVTALKAHEIQVQDQNYQFDLVCDTRGLGAKSNWDKLRGIRGELVWLHAPEVKLECPVRILHPRYPIYISPRANHLYVVGATSIESEDISPISVASILELLSAAYTVHSGFAEARLVNTLTQSRPSFPDQQPKISYSDGLLKINGLYRHGYMVGPAVIQDALRLLESGRNSVKFPELLDGDG